MVLLRVPSVYLSSNDGADHRAAAAWMMCGMTAASVVALAAMLVCTARLFVDVGRLHAFARADVVPRKMRRHVGRMYRDVGWWQLAIAAVLIAGGAPDTATTTPALFWLGALMLLAGYVKAPTPSTVWLARRWRPLRVLLWIGR